MASSETHPRKAERVEPFMTVKEAAAALGLQYWKLQRALKSGQLPSYALLNSRRLIRLSEVIAVLEASRQGGPS